MIRAVGENVTRWEDFECTQFGSSLPVRAGSSTRDCNLLVIHGLGNLKSIEDSAERYCTNGTHVGLLSRGSTCNVGERIVSVFVEFFVQAVRTISVN